jgi:uncharacterized protein (DUF3084 family)
MTGAYRGERGGPGDFGEELAEKRSSLRIGSSGDRPEKGGIADPVLPSAMKHWTTAFSRLRRVLARNPEPDAGETPAEEPAAPLPTATKEADETATPEFTDLLAAIGSEGEAPDLEAVLALKDFEIAELRSMLSALRPLGDQLAEIESSRIAEEESSALRLTDAKQRSAVRKKWLLEKLRLFRDEHVARDAHHDQEQAQEIQTLQDTLAKREAMLKRTRGWHVKARERAEERSRKAANRWREILTLRRRIKDLERKLDRI